MRQCIGCHEIKATTGPLREFSPRQARCFKCRSEVRRLKRLERAGKPVPLPSRYIAPFNAVKRLYREWTASTKAVPMEVPVRVRNHIEPSPKACMIRLVNGESWIYIGSRMGQRQLLYTATSPDALIYALEAMGLEILAPSHMAVEAKK